MFQRKIYQKLLEWKNGAYGDCSILIDGARRIGKSTIAEEFGKNEFDDYLLIDFRKANQNIKDSFGFLHDSMDKFFAALFLAVGRKAMDRGSLIIFDEIQFFPKAREWIKDFVADGRYRYIETGSLISIKRNEAGIMIPSEEKRLYMYPMDFEEFLLAIGDEASSPMLKKAFESSDFSMITQGIHRDLMQKYRLYLALGGMPKPLSKYIENQDFLQAEQEKRTILDLYGDDLRSNDAKDKTRMNVLYQNLATQLGKAKSKRFIVGHIFGRSGRLLSDTLNNLESSRVVNLVYRSSSPEMGLSLFKAQTDFKAYSSDVGLLVSKVLTEIGDETIYRKIIFAKDSANLGMFYENAVVQALVCNGYDPYYFTFADKGSSYEIDCMIQRKGRICAIEVKSSSSFSTVSLDCFKKIYRSPKKDYYVLSPKMPYAENGVVFLPLYFAFCF